MKKKAIVFNFIDTLLLLRPYGGIYIGVGTGVTVGPAVGTCVTVGPMDGTGVAVGDGMDVGTIVGATVGAGVAVGLPGNGMPGNCVGMPIVGLGNVVGNGMPGE
jgi:hypothetical protein